MILLVGIPGSGKSTLADMLEAGNPLKYVRINQDRIGSRHKCERLCRQAFNDGLCPVIDRCNFNTEQRAHFIKIAKEYNAAVDVIVFAYPVEECIQRCENRTGHETVSPSEARTVVGFMAKEFRPPQRDDGLFRTVNHVHNFNMAHHVAVQYLSDQ